MTKIPNVQTELKVEIKHRNNFINEKLIVNGKVND
jgi:hypothetical protein